MSDIKIKYDGRYPNLCFGHLEVWIDDTYYDFGNNSLTSGGDVFYMIMESIGKQQDHGV